MSFSLLLFLLLSFILSFLVTKLAIRYATNFGLFDIPGKRTSHNVITPRGGGISIIMVYLFFISLYWWIGYDDQYLLILDILICGSVISLVGFWDDHQDVPAKLRILIHFIAAIISVLYFLELPELLFFSTYIGLPFLLVPLYTIFLVWMLNLYNFMDGIDGLASVEAITVLISASLIFYLQGNSTYPNIMLILAASVVGFLIWNWPPAKIFMGDAGSGFIGFTVGLIMISTSNSNDINLWSWLILLSVFIVDATFTLLQRITKGGNWYEAHRSHAYQILSRKFKSHRKVTIGVLIINAIWLFPLAYLTARYEYWAPLFSLIAITPLIFIAYRVDAGINND